MLCLCRTYNNMVYYEEVSIDHSTVGVMYSCNSFTPCSQPGLYNMSPTLPNTVYGQQSPAGAPYQTVDTAAQYYDQGYRHYGSWQTGKDDFPYPQTGTWGSTAPIGMDAASPYKQEYYPTHQGIPTVSGAITTPSQTIPPSQYPQCSMMSSHYGMMSQQNLDDDLVKERQSGYGWITNSVSNNCK